MLQRLTSISNVFLVEVNYMKWYLSASMCARMQVCKSRIGSHTVRPPGLKFGSVYLSHPHITQGGPKWGPVAMSKLTTKLYWTMIFHEHKCINLPWVVPRISAKFQYISGKISKKQKLQNSSDSEGQLSQVRYPTFYMCRVAGTSAKSACTGMVPWPSGLKLGRDMRTHPWKVNVFEFIKNEVGT